MNVSITDLSPDQLRRAADVAEQIESLKNELSEILDAELGPSGHVGRQKRKISAAGIAHIRAAQKARVATAKGAGGLTRMPNGRRSAASSNLSHSRRKISPCQRK